MGGFLKRLTGKKFKVAKRVVKAGKGPGMRSADAAKRVVAQPSAQQTSAPQMSTHEVLSHVRTRRRGSSQYRPPGK